MPILRKYEGKRLLEDYEEINEHSPLFINDYEEDESSFSLQQPQTNLPFWKKWWTILKSKFLNA